MSKKYENNTNTEQWHEIFILFDKHVIEFTVFCLGTGRITSLN